MESILFKIQLLICLYMTGLIWFVQIVHYPLFAAVRKENFVAYEQQHTHRTSFVTAPPMLIELFSAILLVYFGPDNSWLWINLIGVVALWASTFFIQVPLHNKLSKEHDAQAIKKLVKTNWIRTFIWSVRAVLLISMI